MMMFKTQNQSFYCGFLLLFLPVILGKSWKK